MTNSDVIAAPLLLSMFLAQGGAAVSSDPALQLRESIRAQPQVESNYTNLGNLLLRAQRFPEAITVLEDARRRFPRSGQAALSLGVAYYALRRFDDAVRAFLDAGRLEPDVEQPVAFLSRMQENWGERKPLVVALFRQYAARHPRQALGHAAVGIATGDAASLRKAVQLDPGMAAAHFELGVVLEKRRDYAGAIAAFERAAELRPTDPDPHYRLSRLYARSGDETRARAERALHEKLTSRQTSSGTQSGAPRE